MDLQKVGTRGYLFTFNNPYHTNVYVINAPKHIYVLDTFLGPTPMRLVKDQLMKEGVKDKPYIAFNSHADYDHYWGNQEFSGGWIIAHDSANRRIQAQGEENLKEYRQYSMGEVKITQPNLLFRKKLTLPEDKLEFIYTPGHTGDSASVWDPVDHLLFVGDNIEAPFPQINLLNLKDWQTSLEEYIKLEPIIIVSGHDPIMRETKLLQENLEYIKGLQSLKVPRVKWAEQHRLIHYRNLRRLGGLFAGRGDPRKALDYYREALDVLNESEKTIENSERRSRLDELILNLG
ncbi:MAG: MBL fold metallo-hydrolase [Candidatus Bathyarchaeota archaeon]|nr:MBL fold metallo-hydrolase [Candidatus Bathyarchaeota archaeon]